MKTFRTERLRLAGLLLTGNPTDGNGTLWYNGVKLAQGSNAAEEGRELLPGSGLYGLQNSTLILDGNASPDDVMDLQTDLEFHVSGRSGISVENDFLFIDKGAIVVKGAESQLEHDQISVNAGAGLTTNKATLELGDVGNANGATLSVNVDDASIEIGTTNDDLRLKDGTTTRDNSAEFLVGIQESHLQSVDWARADGPGGDALAVENHLTPGSHMVVADLGSTSNAYFDGSTAISVNAKTVGANLVVVSGERVLNPDGSANSNHYLQVIGGSKEWQDDATFKGDVTIDGAITVQGDVIQVDSNQVNIGDNIIVLNFDLGTSDSPENGGIDVRIGNLENTSILGGPARVWFNTSSTVRAWQMGNVKDWGTAQEDYSDMWTVHTQKYSRVLSVPCTKDENHLFNFTDTTLTDDPNTDANEQHRVDFALALDSSATAGDYEFPSIPNIVASLTYTGTATTEPEQVSWIVKDVTTSGCKVDFSADIPLDYYDMKLFVSTL